MAGSTAVNPLAIHLDAVVRHQGSFTLGPLDMQVPTGMVTGFVGPNGAGKTTAIKAMLGMVGINSGQVSVLGGAPGTQHERLGVTLDAVALAQDWNALTAARALRGLYPDWDQTLFEGLLSRLDVPSKVRVKSLSRGQGVKLQLALALAHHPELLILDEPTSGLDPVARLDVLDVFREFMVEEGHTLLFSTHITSDLERIADHLHVIGHGRTCFSGPISELQEEWAMARGPLAALTPPGRAALTGLRQPSRETFEGLMRVRDTALFGPEVLIEPPALDEAVAALTREPRTTTVSTSGKADTTPAQLQPQA